MLEHRLELGLPVPMLETGAVDLSAVEYAILDDFWRLRVASPADNPIAIETLIAYRALSSEERRLVELMSKLDSAFFKFQAAMSPERRKRLRERDDVTRLRVVPKIEGLRRLIGARRKAVEGEEEKS